MQHAGQANIDHVRQFGADCGDPDCELHSPWVIEDEAARQTAIAHYIAGARSAASDVEDLLQGALEEKLQNIEDEQMGERRVP